MTREHGYTFAITALMGVIVYLLVTGSGKITEAENTARSAEHELATLLPVIDALEDSATLATTSYAILHDSLTVERQERAVERAGFRASIETEQAEHETLIDSVIARVDSTTAMILERARVADNIVHANYERTILSQADDIDGLHVELGKVTALAALNAEGWALSDAALAVSQVRGDNYRVALEAQKRKGTIVRVAAVATVLCTKFCPLVSG